MADPIQDDVEAVARAIEVFALADVRLHGPQSPYATLTADALNALGSIAASVLIPRLSAAKEEALEAVVNDAIDAWNFGPASGELHKALGWTWDEYRAWVERSELPSPFHIAAPEQIAAAKEEGIREGLAMSAELCTRQSYGASRREREARIAGPPTSGARELQRAAERIAAIRREQP